MLQQRAVAVLMIPAITSGLTPRRAARPSASLVPIIWMARARLLQSFAADPEPAPPQRTTFLPIICSSAEARSKAAASSLPTMKVSVAASAAPTPPLTGASAKTTPRLAAASATSCDVLGATVLQSTISVPGAAVFRRPPGPRYVSFTCAHAGSMVTTASAPSATSATEPAATALPGNSPARLVATSCRISRKATAGAAPALARLRPMWTPMLPRPTKPRRPSCGAALMVVRGSGGGGWG
mmetsp:Transcript_9143/g.26693  ORF Transcript_9143/g.26693 Transcript_9143/m.26693 type:complete len:240 (+) Transcript_9143:1192-1911(+)